MCFGGLATTESYILLTSVRRMRKMVKIAKRFLPFFSICAARSAAQMTISNSRSFIIEQEVVMGVRCLAIISKDNPTQAKSTIR